MGFEKNRAPLESAENAARKLGRIIIPHLPAGWGFCLLLSSYGEKGLSTYIANQDRECTIKLLREIADKLESGAPQV